VRLGTGAHVRTIGKGRKHRSTPLTTRPSPCYADGCAKRDGHPGRVDEVLATVGLREAADRRVQGATFVAALLGALGVGALLHNQIVAVTGLLIVDFVIEPTLATLLPQAVRFDPILGAPSGILDITPDSVGAPSGPLAHALAVSIAWASATFVAAAAFLRRRDLV
jgi:hypothetical protein